MARFQDGVAAPVPSRRAPPTRSASLSNSPRTLVNGRLGRAVAALCALGVDQFLDLGAGLDLSRPLAVLLVSVLPFVPDAVDPAVIVTAYRDARAPGSYLAISHGTNDYRPKGRGGRVRRRGPSEGFWQYPEQR